MISLDLGTYPNDVALAFYGQIEALHGAIADTLVMGSALTPAEEEDLTRALIPIARIRQLCKAHVERLDQGEREDIRERGRMMRLVARRGAAHSTGRKLG